MSARPAVALFTPVSLVFALLALLALLAVPSSARATYSITAADTETKEVGGAGASCVPYEVVRIYGVAPGHGAVNAQAYFDDEALAQAVDLLAADVDPASVLAAITDPEAHPVAPKMQWGLVDASGRSARSTGPEAQPYAADIGGSTAEGRFVFTTQGNILTSGRVLDQARDGFVMGGCDLADRLVRGLEMAGAEAEGDSRCTPDGRPAKSAYVDVTGPEGARLHISVPDVSPADPIPLLRAEYDAWRLDHPCPVAADPPVMPAGDVGSEGACSVVQGRAGGAGSGLLALFIAWGAAALSRRARRYSPKLTIAITTRGR